MAEGTELMTLDNICNRVYVIRGQQVMLDYGLPTEQAYMAEMQKRMPLGILFLFQQLIK